MLVLTTKRDACLCSTRVTVEPLDLLIHTYYQLHHACFIWVSHLSLALVYL